MLKVATFGYGIDGGGAEYQLKLLEKTLEEKYDLFKVRVYGSCEPDIDYKTFILPRSNSYIQKFLNNIKLITAIRKYLSKNQIETVVSFTTRINIYVLIACFLTATKVIVCERNILSNPRLGYLWKALRFIIYPLSRYVVLQTRAELDVAYRYIPFTQRVIIHNMISDIPTKYIAVNKVVRIVFVGRKIYQKGFDIGLEAIRLLDDNLDGIKVEFVGIKKEGELNHSKDLIEFKRLVSLLRLDHRVKLRSWQTQNDLFTDGDIFVLSSRYEGFPNIVLEAMSKGGTMCCI